MFPLRLLTFLLLQEFLQHGLLLSLPSPSCVELQHNSHKSFGTCSSYTEASSSDIQERKGKKKRKKKESDSNKKAHSENIRTPKRLEMRRHTSVTRACQSRHVWHSGCLDQSIISTGEKHWILLQAGGSREDKWQEGRPVTMTTTPFLVPETEMTPVNTGPIATVFISFFPGGPSISRATLERNTDFRKTSP